MTKIRNVGAEGFIMFVVYARPLDFPAHYVVRKHFVNELGNFPARVACVYNTIDEARMDLPESAAFKIQSEGDDPDPCIAEVWV